MNRVIILLACSATLVATALAAPTLFGQIGCTIMINRPAGGTDVFVEGCPTNHCDPGVSDCEYGDDNQFCECSSGPQTAGCKGKVRYNPDGETLNGFSCARVDCIKSCTKLAWLPPEGTNYVCYCPDNVPVLE